MKCSRIIFGVVLLLVFLFEVRADPPVDAPASIYEITREESVDHSDDSLLPSKSFGEDFRKNGAENSDRLIRLTGFQYCQHFDNSVFDAAARINIKKLVRIIQYLEKSPSTSNGALIPQSLAKLSSKKKTLRKRDRFKRFLKKLWGFMRTFKWEKEKYQEPYADYIELHEIADDWPFVVDEIARSLHEHQISRYGIRPLFTPKAKPVSVAESSSISFACYQAADAGNQWVDMSLSGRVLVFVDSQTYFRGEIPFTKPSMDFMKQEFDALQIPSESVNMLPAGDRTIPKDTRDKVAYFLLVHNNYMGVQTLIDELASSDSIMLIHVDAKNAGLKQQINDYLARKNISRNRVRVMEKSFYGRWGHSSLVFAYLVAIFELLDMNQSWEYVLNLSGYDIPLWSPAQMYRQLKVHGSSNWIDELDNSEMKRTMVSRPVLVHDEATAGRTSIWKQPSNCEGPIQSLKDVCKIAQPAFTPSPHMQLPFRKWKTLHKQHQWMILHRKTVEIVRSSSVAATFLAYADFTIVPDESYFSTLLAHINAVDPDTRAIYRIPIIPRVRTMFFFKGYSPRPITLNDRDQLQIAARNGYFFARKVDIPNNQELVRWILDNKARNWIEQ
eukprot:Partr_v1_DN26864_c2_g1_i2_m40922